MSVTQERFDQFKKQMQGTDDLVKKISISKLSVTKDSLKDSKVFIDGNPVKVTPGFFAKMGGLLRLNQSLTRNMLKNGDHAIAAALINGIKDYSASNKDKNILLVGDPKTKTLTDITTPRKYSKVTNGTVFDMADRLLNENPTLSISNIDTDPYSGKLSINFLNDKEINFASAGADEFFKFGFSLMQTGRRTEVDCFNQRLVCENGMISGMGGGTLGSSTHWDKKGQGKNVATNFEDSFNLKGSTPDDVRDFLGKIENMKKANFVSPLFKSLIERANTTRASMLEVEGAIKSVQSRIHHEDPEIKKRHVEAMIANHFPGYETALNRIKKKVDYSSISGEHKKFIKSGHSVWDVVNSLTYLGSNQTSLALKGANTLKAEGGEFFGKGNKGGYDLEFAKYAEL